MQQQLAQYRIEELLGEGAFAWVYRAFDQKLERFVALKLLKPVWLNDPQALARFEREAKTMARLYHPHIVQVYDVDRAEGHVYLAQFLVAGESLATRLKRGPLPWAEMLDILRQVASALDYAHQQGVIHRDLKPANILLGEGQSTYLSDFGLVGAAEGSTSLSASSGGLIGTPGYMAPEQWRGERPTPATDVYALSCIVVEMLTGRVLFDAPTPPAVMTKHVLDGPNFPTRWPVDVPAGLTEVLQRGLARNPTERINRAGELVATLAGLAVEGTIKPESGSAAVPLPLPPTVIVSQSSAALPKQVSRRLIFSRAMILLAGITILLVVGTILFFALGGRDGAPTALPSVTSATIIADLITATSTLEPITPTASPTDVVVTPTPAITATLTPTTEVITANQTDKWCSGVNLVFFPGGPAGGIFTNNVYKGAKQAEAVLGPTVKYVFSDWDPDKMTQQFQEAVATKPDGIAIMGHPGDEAFDPLIDKAISQGILITSQNITLPKAESKYSATGFGYVGQDLYGGGFALGNEAAKRFGCD